MGCDYDGNPNCAHVVRYANTCLFLVKVMSDKMALFLK